MAAPPEVGATPAVTSLLQRTASTLTETPSGAKEKLRSEKLRWKYSPIVLEILETFDLN